MKRSHPRSYIRVFVVKLFAWIFLSARIFLFTFELIQFHVFLGEKQQHGGWPWPLPKRIWHRGAQWHDGGDWAGPPSAHAAVWGPGEYRHWEGLWQGEYWGTGAGWVREGAINTGECVCVCDSWWGEWTNQEEEDQTLCFITSFYLVCVRACVSVWLFSILVIDSDVGKLIISSLIWVSVLLMN